MYLLRFLYENFFLMMKISAVMSFGSEALLSQLFISSNTGSSILKYEMKECMLCLHNV